MATSQRELEPGNSAAHSPAHPLKSIVFSVAYSFEVGGEMKVSLGGLARLQHQLNICLEICICKRHGEATIKL